MLGRQGRGTVNHFDLNDKVDVICGSLSKSLASTGGFIAASRDIIEYLRTHSKQTIFSAAISPGQEHARCLRVLHRFSVRPPEPERVIATLSGGNQQKVIVARWMEAGSRLLVLEEPTFGVDVGSKAEIYQLLQQALDRGLAVLLISSDFEEVAGICHRALIFDRGRVAAELQRAELSLAHLTALASGGDEKRIQARLA